MKHLLLGWRTFFIFALYTSADAFEVLPNILGKVESDRIFALQKRDEFSENTAVAGTRRLAS